MLLTVAPFPQLIPSPLCVTSGWDVPQGMAKKEQLLGEVKLGPAEEPQMFKSSFIVQQNDPSWENPGVLQDSQFGHWAGEHQEVRLVGSLFLSSNFPGKLEQGAVWHCFPSSVQLLHNSQQEVQGFSPSCCSDCNPLIQFVFVPLITSP